MKLLTFIKRSIFFVPNEIKTTLIPKNYKKVLKRLKKQLGKEKIKVGVYNSENSKWVYQSLYDEFNKSKLFEPFVLLTLPEISSSIDITKLQTNYEFFKTKKMNVVFAFDVNKKKHIPINKFDVDIVFIDEPWSISPCQDVYSISKKALCCYCSYGCGTSNGRNEYNSRIFKQVWKYFLDNKTVKQVLINHGLKGDNLVVSGSIKLDAYLSPLNPTKQLWETNNFRIIYAPHFSFSKNSILKFGTFDKYYNFFLNFAKKHPEFEFVFKPHPNLKKEITKQYLMTETETEKYYSEWANLPNSHLYTNGDYFDIFKTSDLMITDCNSFLSEYLPSQKPLIQLISNNSVGLNYYRNEICKGYYKVHNLKELQETLENIIHKKTDTLLGERKRCLDKMILPKNGVAKFIENDILSEIMESK